MTNQQIEIKAYGEILLFTVLRDFRHRIQSKGTYFINEGNNLMKVEYVGKSRTMGTLRPYTATAIGHIDKDGDINHILIEWDKLRYSLGEANKMKFKDGDIIDKFKIKKGLLVI